MSHLLTVRSEAVKLKSNGRRLTAAAALNEIKSVARALDSNNPFNNPVTAGAIWHGECFLPSTRLTWPSLDTAILRTCKSLHAEGQRSLNSNNFMWLQLALPQWQLEDVAYALRDHGIPAFRIRHSQARTPAPVLVWKITNEPAQQDIPPKTHFAIPFGSLTRFAWLLNTSARPKALKGRIEVKYHKYVIPGCVTSDTAIDKLYMKTIYPFLSNQIAEFNFGPGGGDNKTRTALADAIKARWRVPDTDAAAQVWAEDLVHLRKLTCSGHYDGNLPWEVTLHNAHREISRTLFTLPDIPAAPESYAPYITLRFELHFFGAMVYMNEAFERAKLVLDSYQNLALQAIMHANFVNSGCQEYFVTRIVSWDKTPKESAITAASLMIMLISISLLDDADAATDKFLKENVYPCFPFSDQEDESSGHEENFLAVKTAYLRRWGDNAQNIWNSSPSLRATFFLTMAIDYFHPMIEAKWSGEYKLSSLGIPTLETMAIGE